MKCAWRTGGDRRAAQGPCRAGSRRACAQSRLDMQQQAAGWPRSRQGAADSGARLQFAVQLQRLVRQDVLGAHARVPGPATTTYLSTTTRTTKKNPMACCVVCQSKASRLRKQGKLREHAGLVPLPACAAASHCPAPKRAASRILPCHGPYATMRTRTPGTARSRGPAGAGGGGAGALGPRQILFAIWLRKKCGYCSRSVWKSSATLASTPQPM